MPHIDRATDLLVAVCYGPTHARLGEKDGQHAAQPYVFIGLAMTVFARAKPRHRSLAPAWLARGAPVASGPCHDRPNHVARFAAQRHIGNFGMISQIAAKPELSKAAHLGSYWFCSGSIKFEAVDNRVLRIICQCSHDWRSSLS